MVHDFKHFKYLTGLCESFFGMISVGENYQGGYLLQLLQTIIKISVLYLLTTVVYVLWFYGTNLTKGKKSKKQNGDVTFRLVAEGDDSTPLLEEVDTKKDQENDGEKSLQDKNQSLKKRRWTL